MLYIQATCEQKQINYNVLSTSKLMDTGMMAETHNHY